MKTDAFTVTLGVLLLLLGGMVLYCNGTVSGFFGNLGFHTKFQPAASAAGFVQLLLAPVVGWFVFGMGAVLTGLNLHAKKLI
jgi:hypothetical protein